MRAWILIGLILAFVFTLFYLDFSSHVIRTVFLFQYLIIAIIFISNLTKYFPLSKSDYNVSQKKRLSNDKLQFTYFRRF